MLSRPSTAWFAGAGRHAICSPITAANLPAVSLIYGFAQPEAALTIQQTTRWGRSIIDSAGSGKRYNCLHLPGCRVYMSVGSAGRLSRNISTYDRGDGRKLARCFSMSREQVSHAFSHLLSRYPAIFGHIQISYLSVYAKGLVEP